MKSKYHLVKNSLRPYAGCWVWELVCVDPDEKDQYNRPLLGRMRTYSTGPRKTGLFIVLNNGEERQIEGTCQFALSEDETIAKRQIRRYFRKRSGVTQ